MKKFTLISIILLSVCFSGRTQSTVTLEFRVNSPRIIYDWNNTMNSGSGGYCQNLDLDLEVKGNAVSYCHALEFHMTTNMSALTDLDYTMAAGWTTWYSLITFNLTGGNINLSVANSKPQNSGNTSWWTQIPTTWIVVGTLRLRITDATAMENCTWLTAQMAGQQYEKYFTPSPGIRPYLGFNCDGTPVSNLYLGRIYSSTWLWSQTGGSSAGNQYINWTTAVNTSVWDTLSSAATIDNTGSKTAALRIHSGANLVISPGKDLSCSGATEINEAKGLVIAANSTGMGQFIDNGTITYPSPGSAMAECYFAQNKYHYYTVPVQSTNVIPFQNLYMAYYKEPLHSWKWVVSAGTMDSILNTPMQGYAIWPDSTSPPVGNFTAKVTGVLNTGSFSFNVTNTYNPNSTPPGYDGYNFTGNPYVSAIDLGSGGITWNNVEHKAWFWKPSAGNYCVYVVAGGGNHSQYAPPQQGFFVHFNTGSSPTTLAVNNSARIANDTVTYLKDSGPLQDYLVLTAEKPNSESYGQAMVYFRPEATDGYDELYDARHMTGNNDAPQFYSTIQDTNLTLNSLPWTGPDKVVPMGFSCGQTGDFLIAAANTGSFRAGIMIYLEDLKEQKMTNLRTDSVYPFTYLAGEDPNRFILHFNNPYVGLQEKDPQNMLVYSYEDLIYINSGGEKDISGTITLFDLYGRTVFSSSLANVPVQKFHPGVTQGCYVVMVNRKVYLN